MSAPAPAQSPPSCQPVKNDVQHWVLYLGGILVVDKDSRLSPQEIWQSVNRLNKSKFPFSLVNSYWSKSGHTIILAFDKNNDPDNILIHTNAILHELAHRKPTDKMQLRRDGRMGKVFLNNVPCRNPSDMDQVISEGDLQLEIAKNPFLNRLQFINKPHWATKDLDDEEKDIQNRKPCDFVFRVMVRKRNRLRRIIAKAKRDWAFHFASNVEPNKVWSLNNWYKGIRKYKIPPISHPDGSKAISNQEKANLFGSSCHPHRGI